MDNNRQLDYDQRLPRCRAHHPLQILLDNLTNPENVGAVFRIADALGIEKLYLGGATAAPPNRRLSRVARSTDRNVPYEAGIEPIAALEKMQTQGTLVIGLEITNQSRAIHTLDCTRFEAICLVVGGERDGVSESILDLVDETVHLPMRGINSSMNVAVACALACYEIIGQWTRAASVAGIRGTKTN